MNNTKNIQAVNNELASSDETNKAGSKPLVIPVIEEQLIIDKKLVESGKVTITKKVHEVIESVDIPIIQEEVSVDRIEINQYVESPPPATRQEGEKTIISILKEVLVVEKKTLLVEEIHITRKQVKTSEKRQESLKKEEIIISRENKDLT